ncbi:hypothetical protein [Nocardioides sp. BYT-33-1]|uniref:hypothetical protein n=1 Tax=Nocardioides sp. BYT-33-1 TaxID=3416952 RepID=UPI003F533673
MSTYLLGIATLPTILVVGYLSAWLLGRLIATLTSLHLGIWHRVRPDDERMTRERRAAVMYGLRHGVVFSLGEFVLVVGRDLDEDRRHWAARRLLRRLDVFEPVEDTAGGEQP